MSEPIRSIALHFVAFAIACAVSWIFGSILFDRLWKFISEWYGFPIGKTTALAYPVGGLERSLYIYGVMADRYELITGWLVMKAFFGWIHIRQRATDADGHEQLNKFNRYLIGNLLSLFIGIGCGLVAKIAAD